MLFESVRARTTIHGVRLVGVRLAHGEHSIEWQDFIYLCCLSAAIQELEDARNKPAARKITIASHHLQPYAEAKTRAAGLEALASQIRYVDIPRALINNPQGDFANASITLTYNPPGPVWMDKDHLISTIRGVRCVQPWLMVEKMVLQVVDGTWEQSSHGRRPIPDDFRESVFDDALHAYSSSVVKLITLASDHHVKEK